MLAAWVHVHPKAGFPWSLECADICHCAAPGLWQRIVRTIVVSRLDGVKAQISEPQSVCTELMRGVGANDSRTATCCMPGRRFQMGYGAGEGILTGKAVCDTSRASVTDR